MSLKIRNNNVEKNEKTEQLVSLIEMQPEIGTAWVYALKQYLNIIDLKEEKTKEQWLSSLNELKNKKVC